ncbi:T9SS C-terminal target domain-containing protein [Chitinophaga pinensis]|uniref:Gliding motility-associated-like protein n=1 Tax=Chitinophaga pinensis (strain ATCC 43595 / DSM 2588 / LMG 13176 / NBRC 15968 / NCIMB 11800 / UQM 2034) TaxID=485918 RepID=A0A979GWC9_CHIPD|nr:T9SS C-terminal target domain-containing protein [Chitinophaga pinensis]ACU60440.1 hypothetical protein Cpin_2962 [Chitinophaga pinensis DSM 2588]
MKFVFFILSLLIAGNVYSQCTSSTFRFILRGNGSESAQSIIEIAGGDMIIGGETTSFGAGNTDLFLTRITRSGQIVWSKTYGGAAREQFRRMSLALDGSIILAAQTFSYGNSGGEAMAMKIDVDGNLLWSSKFSISGDTSLGLDILSTTDNGYILTGLEYASSYASDWMIVKLDDAGNILWTKRLALDSDETAYSAIQKGDTLIVTGMGRHPYEHVDIYLKMSLADGTLYTTDAYSIDNRSSFSTKIEHSPVGEYRVGVHIIDGADYTQKQDGFIIFDDNMLPKQAFKLDISTPYNNGWYSGFVQTADNGYILASSPRTGNTGYLFKFDQNHNLVYTKRFTSTQQMWTGYTIEATDGSIWTVGSEDNHVLVMKLTAAGMFDNCPNEDVSRTTTPVSYTKVPGYAFNSITDYNFLNTQFTAASTNFTFNVDSLCKTAAVCGDISIQGRDTVCSLTDSVTYIARTGACGIGTASWTLPAGATSRIVNDSTIRVVFGTAGAQQLIVENQLACEVQRDTLLVRVLPAPVLELGRDSIVCNGLAVTLDAGAGFRTYRWQDGSTAQTYIVNGMTGRYYVTTTDYCNNVFSDTIRVNYRSLADFSVYPTDTTLCSPSPINFLATGGDTYVWTPATYLNNASISNPVGTPTASIVYNVMISDTVCMRNQQLTATIHIETPPTLELGADTIICNGAAVTLDAGAGFQTYRWQDGSTSSTLTATAAGEYYVDVTDNCNHIISDTIHLSYRTATQFAVTPTDTTVCASAPVNFQAAGGDVYTWTPNTYLSADNVSNPIATPTQSITYNLVISDTVCNRSQSFSINVNVAQVPTLELGADSTICDAGNITLDAGAGFRSYRWQDGSTSQTLTINASGTYYVDVIDNCNNASSDTIRMNYRPATLFTVTPADTAICLPGQINYRAAGGDTYAWTPNTYLSADNISNPVATPTQAITYNVVISDTVCHRTQTRTVNVTINQTPLLELGADSTICDGRVITLDAGAGFRTYSWQDGSTSRTYTVNAQSGEYYVRATDNCNNIVTDTIQLDYRSAAAFTVNPSDTSYCELSQINFLATGGDTYRWTPSTYLSADNISNPIGMPTESIEYSLLISDTVCHRTEQMTVRINIDPVPDVTVSKSNDINCSVGAAQLIATGGTRYEWSPVTGLNNPAVANPVARPGASTTYAVRVYNATGCYTDDSIRVEFLKTGSAEIYAPTGFTPNGDGVNDIFRLRSSGENKIKVFSVYNRWGELVFTTTDASKGWNGMYKGAMQEAGSYYWFVQASNPCDGEFLRKGHVILIK